MSATASAEQSYCARCSDPVDAVDEEGNGRCCHQLPEPWLRGRDGLFNRTRFSDDVQEDDDDDDDDDCRPQCPYCGEREFRLVGVESHRVEMSHRVNASDNDLEDSTVWYDRCDFDVGDTRDTYDFELESVFCCNCDRDVTGSVCVEEGEY